MRQTVSEPITARGDIHDNITSFRRHLRARSASPRTIETYIEATINLPGSWPSTVYRATWGRSTGSTLRPTSSSPPSGGSQRLPTAHYSRMALASARKRRNHAVVPRDDLVLVTPANPLLWVAPVGLVVAATVINDLVAVKSATR